LITESFLNSCFTIILNKQAKIQRTKALYRDVLEILAFCETRETVEIPVVVASKLDCLKKINELLLTDKTLDNVLDSITFSEKYKQHRDFLDVKINEELKDHVIQDCVKQIRLRKKINALFQNYDELNEVLESIKDGSFDSIDDLVEDYEVTIKALYSNMMESNRTVTIEAAASLDLVKDDYNHVVEMIMKKYDKSGKTSTGFSYLDDKILVGGYEPSRLYIWGGGSGAGKSTMLNNTIIFSAINNPSLMQEQKKVEPGKINKVYVYITCENTIEEALMRTYMPMFDRTTEQMLSDITQGVDIKKKIMDELAKSGSTIIMKYFPAMSISSFDLMSVLDDAIEEYGEDSIAGLYIDYLDLLKTDAKYDIYRMELGHITLSLKTLAVQYNIPVITGTQLGRSAYKISESRELSVDQISESIKKVEHADFVGLLAKDPVDDKLVHGMVGKNRSGKSNIALDFTVDFSRFKFINALPVSMIRPDDATKKRKDGDPLKVDVTFDGVNLL
jgi:replicative DNA helicase